MFTEAYTVYLCTCILKDKYNLECLQEVKNQSGPSIVVGTVAIFTIEIQYAGSSSLVHGLKSCLIVFSIQTL